MMQAPVTVLQTNTKRDTGKKAQYGNIMAGKVRGAGHQAAWRRAHRWSNTTRRRLRLRPLPVCGGLCL